jgi:hypothetical protein
LYARQGGYDVGLEHGRFRHFGLTLAALLPLLVCAQAQARFDAGASADENSLIGAGRSMIVENNYGYRGPASVEGGQITTAGFARVDLNRSGTGCRLVWTNRIERAPTVVSKLSTADGLIYTYTKDPGISDPWYWTAIDLRTGRTVYKQLAGTGVGYNHNYSGIAISPARTEYVGTLGGIIAVRDG